MQKSNVSSRISLSSVDSDHYVSYFRGTRLGSQVREVTAELMQLKPGICCAIFIVGHVTKEGTLAEILVCWSIWWIPCFTLKGTPPYLPYLESSQKPFSSTNEIGIFGLIR